MSTFTRRDFLRATGVAAGAVLAPGCLLGQESRTKPNIIFILADDQRNHTLGCAGHPTIKTPNIDALAADGVRFENAFVNTSICMASRATIFTGLTTTGHGYCGGPSPCTPVIKADVETSFPTLLRQAGYRTGFFGKQHVRFQGGTDGMGMMFDEHKKLSRGPYLKKMPDGSLRHVDEIMGDKSVEFLKSQQKNKPFFLYMSFNISHAEDRDRRPGKHFQWAKKEDGLYEDVEPGRPDLDDSKYYDAAPEFLRDSMNRDRYLWRWDTPDKYRVNMRALYRMLTGMDRIIGRVMKTLEERGMDKNTLIVYSADNGYYMGDRGLAGKAEEFKVVVQAFNVLSDPGKRRAHDLDLGLAESAPAPSAAFEMGSYPEDSGAILDTLADDILEELIVGNALRASDTTLATLMLDLERTDQFCMFREAKTLLYRGSTVSSEKLFTEYLSRSPSNILGRYFLSKACRANGNWGSAEKQLVIALRIGSSRHPPLQMTRVRRELAELRVARPGLFGMINRLFSTRPPASQVIEEDEAERSLLQGSIDKLARERIPPPARRDAENQ